MATPQLQQCFISSSNPAGVGGDTGTAFQHALPAPIGSGNSIIIVASYPVAATATASDNNGNTWGSPVLTASAGTGNYKLSVWFLASANAGTTQFEVTLGATKRQPFKWEIYEYNNLSSVDVSHSATNQSGTSLAAGSMTTTANGDFILLAAHPAGSIGGNPTSWTAGSGFTLMAADIAWTSGQGYPAATQTGTQTTAGAINPAITIAGDATDSFNVVAVAFKTGSSGTSYTGMRVLKHIEQCNNALVGSSLTMQFPTLGNLRFLATTLSDTDIPFSSITDSESNTWTKLSWATDGCQGFFFENAASNSALTATISIPSSVGQGIIASLFDIVGAATSGQPGASVGNSLTSISASATTAPNQPNITPTSSAGSLILAFMNNQGTGGGSTAGLTTGVTSPTGSVWAGVVYTGKTGGSQFDFGDGWAILTNNTTTSAQNWTWSVNTITGGNNVAGAAVEFLPASGGGPTVFPFPLRRIIYTRRTGFV